MLKLNKVELGLNRYFQSDKEAILFTDQYYFGAAGKSGFSFAYKDGLESYVNEKYNGDFNLFFTFIRERLLETVFYFGAEDHLLLVGLVFTIWFNQCTDNDLKTYLKFYIDNLKDSFLDSNVAKQRLFNTIPEEVEFLKEEISHYQVNDTILQSIKRIKEKLDLSQENRDFLIDCLPLELHLLLRANNQVGDSADLDDRLYPILFSIYGSRILTELRRQVVLKEISIESKKYGVEYQNLRHGIDDLTFDTVLRSLITGRNIRFTLRNKKPLVKKHVNRLVRNHYPNDNNLESLLNTNFSYQSLVNRIKLYKSDSIDIDWVDQYIYNHGLIKLFISVVLGKGTPKWLEGASDVLLERWG